MTKALRDGQSRDIRGRRFDQQSLSADLQGAIAGQPLLPKIVLILGLLSCCGLASVVVSVLGTTLGLEIFSLGRLGNTFQESLATTVVVLAWLVTAVYQNWHRGLLVVFVGIGMAIALQYSLATLAFITLADGYFYIATTITILVCWATYALTFCLVRWAIAATDILFLRPRWLKLLILGVAVLGAIAGSVIGSSPDPYQEGTVPAATPAEALIAQTVGILLTVMGVTGAWVANYRRNVPWRYPDGFRDGALVLGAWAGTSFQNLDLSKVNFAGAMLANTDLRGRSLYRTCFRNVQRLERARTDNRYLDLNNPKVQALLTYGSSDDKDFSGLNLQGINLRQTDNLPAADLQDIDFTGANLSGADLRGANLSGAALIQTQLVNADLSGAQLTDACIQDWHITANTCFKGVNCQRIFLRRSPKGHFLDPQPERGEFQPGEFEAWIAEIQRTISLSFQSRLNPQAFAFALTQTALNYQSPDLLSVQKIDAQEDGGMIAQIDMAADGASNIDKAEVHQELTTQYYAAVQQLEAGYQLTLQAKDAEIQNVRQMFESQQQLIEKLAGRLGDRSGQVVVQGEGNQIYMIEHAGGIMVNNQNINAGGNVDMSSGTRINVGGDISGSVDMSSGAKVSVCGDVVGSSINLGTLSGQVTTTIQQLRDVSVQGADELADILTTIQDAIIQDVALSENQKKEAIEAVETIAEEGKKPPEERVTKLCSMAMNALKGVATAVTDASNLASVLQTSLPALVTLIGL